MNRVIPFTEKVLLNSRFLDLICPIDCDKKRISQTGTSIFQTLKDLPKSQFRHDTSPVSRFSSITKPVRIVGRTMVVAIVTLTASPLGVLCYGGLAAAHLIRYSIGTDQTYAAKQLKWNYVSQYATATKNDLICFLTGLVATAILFKGYVCLNAAMALYISGSLVGASFNTALAYLYYRAARCFGGEDPSFYISLLCDTNYKVGLYTALELRNKFGLLNQDGDLLKFSNADHHPYTNVGLVVLDHLNREAELKLIDLVKHTNIILKSNNKPEIRFKYPFSAKEILDHLEKNVHLKHKPEFVKILQNYRDMEYKINSFRELLKGINHITNNFRLHSIFASYKAWQPQAYTDFDSYYEYFYGKASPSSGGTSGKGSNNHTSGTKPNISPEAVYKAPLFSKNKFYDSLDIEIPAVNAKEPNDVFDAFSHRLGVEKRKLKQNKALRPLHELFGLEKFTKDKWKKESNKLRLALHPDKNIERSEKANILLQASNDIYDQIKKDFI